MQDKAFFSWFHQNQQQALMSNERRLVVLSGESDWAYDLLKSINEKVTETIKPSSKTWLIYGDGDHFKANVNKQRFRDKLGSESDVVVFQGEGFSIDAFAALSGTLVAGGIMILLVNDLSGVKSSRFFQRFYRLLNDYAEHVVIEQGDNIVQQSLKESSQKSTDESDSLAYLCATQEQVIAVDAIIKVLRGKRNRPLVLTADRGRGKSSALAIACAELLAKATNDNKLAIVVTAADIGSLTIFYKQLAKSFPAGELQNNHFITQFGTLEFIAVDQLLKKKVTASLLLVDEAAAIPIYLLEQLLNKYSRTVFASTIHGYEGAGRGFTLKFQQILTKNFPQWQNLHINEPIRWRINDPLERLTFDACLLDAALKDIASDDQAIELSSLSFEQVSTTELVNNEKLLRQVFAVLVTAHYQTKPSDVQMLLDNEHVQLVCLFANEQVVGVAMLMNEGRLNNTDIGVDEVHAISQSKRRLKNNFAPQSLLTQCGFEHAFQYSYLRIVRIAVHPQLQHQGLGQYFLAKIANLASRQGTDFLAASFGATAPLLSFWLQSNFVLARIGFTKDKASGEQSALVLKALSNTSETALLDINTEFYRSFDYLLTDEYKFLPTELVALIIHYCPVILLEKLSERDKASITAFSLGHRQYSTCAFSLHLWLKQQLIVDKALGNKSLLILIKRILQKHNVKAVCEYYGFSGKKAFEQRLQSIVKSLNVS